MRAGEQGRGRVLRRRRAERLTDRHLDGRLTHVHGRRHRRPREHDDRHAPLLVRYAWQGFFSPIANDSTQILNLVHAGDLIKLSFSLNGNQGLAVLATPATLRTGLLPAWTPQSVKAAGGGHADGLFPAPQAGRYGFGWQTDAGWAWHLPPVQPLHERRHGRAHRDLQVLPVERSGRGGRVRAAAPPVVRSRGGLRRGARRAHPRPGRRRAGTHRAEDVRRARVPRRRQHGRRPRAAQGGLLVRVDPADGKALVATTPAEPMVMRGREMEGWLRVDRADVADDGSSRWVTAASPTRARFRRSNSARRGRHAVLVGVAHGLGAVAGAGLGEDPVDVGLDGRVAKESARRSRRSTGRPRSA